VTYAQRDESYACIETADLKLTSAVCPIQEKSSRSFCAEILGVTGAGVVCIILFQFTNLFTPLYTRFYIAMHCV